MKELADQYFDLRSRMWSAFEQLVRQGGRFTVPVDTFYPHGVAAPGLPVTTEKQSYFLSRELVADHDYSLHIGEDLIVGSGEVTFIDTDGRQHMIEPDILDLHWLAEIFRYCETGKREMHGASG
jgi:hypothetical protein